MRPRPADRREWPRPATEPRREPDGAAADTAVMDSVWKIGGMHVNVLGGGERFWLWLTKAISVMSSLWVKRKSVSRYAQNGSITHGEIRRCDETNGRVSERAGRDSWTAEGVSWGMFCTCARALHQILTWTETHFRCWLASWLLTVVVCDTVDHIKKVQSVQMTNCPLATTVAQLRLVLFHFWTSGAPCLEEGEFPVLIRVGNPCCPHGIHRTRVIIHKRPSLCSSLACLI